MNQLLVEAFRAEGLTFGPGWRIAQVEGFATLLVGLLVLSFYTRLQPGASNQSEPAQNS